MSTTSLERIQNILHFWAELNLSDEEKERRVRIEGDKLAKKAMDDLMGDPNSSTADLLNKIRVDTTAKPESKTQVSDPESLKRYLEIIGK
jgi:hypothetical protein